MHKETPDKHCLSGSIHFFSSGLLKWLLIHIKHGARISVATITSAVAANTLSIFNPFLKRYRLIPSNLIITEPA